MDVIAAYQLVGSFRGAAVLCGTTHKAVRRVVEGAAGDPAVPPPRKARLRNYHDVLDLVAAQV